MNISPLRRKRQIYRQLNVPYALRMCFLSAGIVGSSLVCAGAQQDQWDHARPSFEVVSIHLHNPAAGGSFDRNFPVVHWAGFSTRMALEQAFRLQGFQIVNAPSWVDSEKYDLDARTDSDMLKLSEPEKYERLEGMWREMLATRYGLVYHRATEKATVYELSCPDKGIKLTPSKPNEPFSMDVSDYRMSMRGISMDDLAGQLSFQSNKIVRNNTGLSGTFDLDIQWTSKGDMLHDVGSTSDSMQGGTTLTQAMLDRYNIKLVPRKEDVPSVVIDKIQRPSQN